MPEFCHLHCHTQFSLLDGASDIAKMMDKAQADGQKAVALTDHGNMFGAFKFVSEANRRDIKPIVGCEFYMVEDRHRKSFLRAKGERDVRYHQLILAKNQTGYQNLSKLCSLGFIEGTYSKFPRIDKEILMQYKEGLIATSCCIGAEIPQTILSGDFEKAEKLVKWWLDAFGSDFYIELQRHQGLENIDNTGMSQEDVNQVLIGFARKFEIPIIATNDSHYIEEDDWKPHDVLLCVNTGNKMSEINRFKFPSSDFYFKTQTEMSALFSDVPEAIANTQMIVDTVESFDLARDVILPNFPLPSGFSNQSDYLKYLVYEGAKLRYGELTEKIRERLDHELHIIKNMGFEGYFLIVQDFIKAARDIGVWVGPGRGSAAGSAVAYALTITNIDPLRYNLLFERFLNPERISMPDIDIDFDDEGRQKVIDWVVDKYGKQQVAQIITFGTMAAKSSIRDVGRVLDLPLNETGNIAKLVPSRPGIKLNKIVNKNIDDIRKEFNSDDDVSSVQKLNEIAMKQDLEGETVQLALKVEGSVRNTGIHAAGVIIAPDDITNYIPVCTSKDTDLLVTQFSGDVVEYAGMLKMDFLGLKTLSIIKDAIENIVKRYGEDHRIDPDSIPLDDDETLKLFQRADTIGIFQFESVGMRTNLKELKPTNIEDLIAMNALYRPGPMDYIPSFIRRKNGKEATQYPHDWLKEILEPTYGIMVYQEQIMQSAQIMADYSLGEADMLRRAMGKKKIKEMERHQEIFVAGATKKGVNEEQAREIFEVMAKFASYGFNRSHAAAYSVLAFQTAYLKAHYLPEFMASVLTHNKGDIDKINFFLRECKRLGIKALGPDINESELNFTVNEKGAIRFGLSALKGVGETPVSELLKARKDGPFESIFDMTRRVDLRSINKRVLESLAYGGAFDSLHGDNRAAFFAPSEKFESLIAHALRYGQEYQSQKQQSANSLFGDDIDVFLKEPPLPKVQGWNRIDKLNREKDVTGIFISGHPLDDFMLEINSFTNCTLQHASSVIGTQLKLAGLVTEAFHGVDKRGLDYCRCTIQDYFGSFKLYVSREEYKKFGSLIETGEVLYIVGMNDKRKGSESVWFRIQDIRLLDSVGKELTKSITVQIPVNQLSSAMLEKLEQICADHAGEHGFKIQLIDQEQDITLDLLSQNQKVSADHEFVQKLEALMLKYKLN